MGDLVNLYLDELLRVTQPELKHSDDDVDLYFDEFLRVTNPDTLAHHGVAHDENPPGRGSGRYPYGQGNRPNQHQWDVKSRYEKLLALNPGATEAQIAAMMGCYQTDNYGNVKLDKNGDPIGSTGKLRAQVQIFKNAVKEDQYQEIKWYDEHINPKTGKTYTNGEIAKLMGLPGESSVRSMRASGERGNQNLAMKTAERLKEISAEKGYLDVGKGTELNLGVSQDRLNTALAILQEQGYEYGNVYVKQVSSSTGQQTTISTLCPPGGSLKEATANLSLIKTVDDPDGITEAVTRRGVGESPRVDLSRIEIKYDEDGGTARDGMIQIRAVRDKNGNLVAACPDLSLGNAKYAQVRIAVEGDRYIKGMAVYNEDITCDILVNSNKSKAKGVDGALKKMDVTKSNPFGAAVVQTYVKDENGKAVLDKDGNQVRSAINIVGSGYDEYTSTDMHKEGTWGTWSKNLPGQFLSKQNYPLVKQQLNNQVKIMEDSLNDIRKINNPTVKRKMLIDFGDQADAAAVDLKAAPIGGQKTHVLLPVTSLKDNEIYAPNFANGTTVALVRFPHAGPFEIPVCVVNNNNKEAKSFMKNATDAVGINQTVASKLSGADFDGDTAIVIPMTRKNSQGEFESVTQIKSAPTLKGLEGFDPTAQYGLDNPRFADQFKVGSDGKKHPTYKYFKTESDKGREMGVISNLITDMYAKGCESEDELADAVRYSMVVIDAKKHELNYKAAFKDYHIQALKDKYQKNIDPETGKTKHGVSSLLSRSKSPYQVDSRAIWNGEAKGSIDPDTGEKVYSDPKRNAYRIQGKKVKVPAPQGYVYTDVEGKEHKGVKYLKDPTTGKDVYQTKGGKVIQGADGTYSYDPGSTRQERKYVYADTEYVRRKQDSTRMAEAKDASELLSDNPTKIEMEYAKYANHMKALANEARKESLTTGHITVNSEAKKKYAKEVQELNDALIKAKKNAPRERQAQILATSKINAELDDHPEYDSEDIRKLKGRALSDARVATGAKKDRVKFTAKQWEAINAGAVAESTLNELLKNSDKDSYMQFALPKSDKISASKKSTIKALYSSGWTQEQIADFLDLSTSSISSIVNG